jgi:hypothetical protein
MQVAGATKHNKATPQNSKHRQQLSGMKDQSDYITEQQTQDSRQRMLLAI